MSGRKRPEYITQLNLYDEWCDFHELTPTADLLWGKLIQLNNKSGWKEWFEVKTSKLAEKIHSSRLTLRKSRQALIDYGLIEYIPGKKGTPGLYRMNFLYRDENGVPTPQKAPEKPKDFTENRYTQTKSKPNNNKREEKRDVGNDEIVVNNLPQSLPQNKEIVVNNLPQNRWKVVRILPLNEKVVKDLPQNGTEGKKVVRNVVRKVVRNVVRILPHKLPQNDSLLYIFNKTKTKTKTKTLSPGNAPDKPGSVSDGAPEPERHVFMSSDGRIDHEAVMRFWNEHHRSMSAIKFMTDARKEAVRRIAREHSTEELMEVILKAEASDFMNGLTGKKWKAGFDWVMKPSNFVKILEGNYDNDEEDRRGSQEKKSIWEICLGGEKPGMAGENPFDATIEEAEVIEDELYANSGVLGKHESNLSGAFQILHG